MVSVFLKIWSLKTISSSLLADRLIQTKKLGSHKGQKNEAPNACQDGRNIRCMPDAVPVPQTHLCPKKLLRVMPQNQEAVKL